VVLFPVGGRLTLWRCAGRASIGSRRFLVPETGCLFSVVVRAWAAPPIVPEAAHSSCSRPFLPAAYLDAQTGGLGSDCYALCWTGADRGTHRGSRELCARWRRDDYARAGDAVLQFNALPLAWSSRSGLLQEHAIRSCCPRPAIIYAERVVLTHRARNAREQSLSPIHCV